MVFALNKIVNVSCHVITQVIESKFIVCTEGNIRKVRLSSFFGVWTVFIDAIHAQSVELVQWTHPFGVTFCQVIIDRYDVYSFSRKCIQVNRKCCHQGFSFSCLHFRNISFVQDSATHQLNIVMHHVPFDVSTSSSPFVVPNRFVAIDGNSVFFLR